LFKAFRIITLLLVFIALAFYSKTQKLKSRNWTAPLEVVIYPMNSEQNETVEDYIQQLDNGVFKEIDTFFANEAEHYKLTIQQPTKTNLGKIIQNFPPPAPAFPFNTLEAVWWSKNFATGLISILQTINQTFIASEYMCITMKLLKTNNSNTHWA